MVKRSGIWVDGMWIPKVKSTEDFKTYIEKANKWDKYKEMVDENKKLQSKIKSNAQKMNQMLK